MEMQEEPGKEFSSSDLGIPPESSRRFPRYFFVAGFMTNANGQVLSIANCYATYT